MATEPEANRRNFLKAGAGAAALGLADAARVLGANDRVRLAVCGLRGRGTIAAWSCEPSL